jgi:ribosomal protein S21
MGVRVVLGDDEPIASALPRLRKLLDREGVTWETRRRRSFVDGTASRRAKEFKQRFKAREATLLAKMSGEQPKDSTTSELINAFWKRTGKP